MTEEAFKKNVISLEEIYTILVKGESNSSQEAELRVAIIDIISSLEASLIGEKDTNNEFIKLLNSARDMMLEWNPKNHWFRHQKQLNEIVEKVITQAKNVVFTNADPSEASQIKDELAALKSELNDLRSLMSTLVKESAPVSDSHDTEEKKDSIIEQQIEPIEKEIIEVQNKTVDPPIILPIEHDPQIEKEDPLPPVIEHLIEEEISEQEQEEVSSFQATSTIQKLSEKRDPESDPETVLSQMRSIIDEAEEETKKQISSFVEQLSQEERSQTPKEVKIVPPSIPEETSKEKVLIQPKESSDSQKSDDSDSLVKPSEIIKQQNSIVSSQQTAGTDPYMQLLTLEAEKYRLEKAVEKNETDFQEGLKSKLEFEEYIQLINKELTTIRQQISSLRHLLTS
ncbi:MAG: hypothetical protein ACTSQK_00290 [Candidatus Heimdallarchaeota archaeon]